MTARERGPAATLGAAALNGWRRLPEPLRDALVLAGLALLVVLLFRPAATGRATFYASDIEDFGLPARSHFARWWGQGVFGWWCPLVDCGFPLFAEGQSGAAYPGTWLFGLVQPLWWALTVNLLGHLWWGGVGAYGWTRSLGACRLGATVAALTFAFSGAMVARMAQLNTQNALAWMPFAAWGFEVGLGGNRRGHLAAGGAVAMQALAGHPHVVLLTLFLLTGRALWAAHRPCWWSPLAALAGVAAVGCIGAAVQILPTLELVPHSVRGSAMTWAVVNDWRLRAEHLPLLFATTARGLPAERGASLPYLAWEWQCTLGRVPLLLLAAAPLVSRRARPWALLAWTAFVLAFGNALYKLLWQLPLWHQQRAPVRLNMVYTAAGCAAVALAVTQWRTVGKRRAIPAAAAAILAAVAIAAAVARPLPVLADPHPSAWGDPVEWVVPLLLLGLGVLVLRCPPADSLLVPVLLILVVTDLWAAVAGLQPLAEPAYWDARSARTARIAEEQVRVHASFTLSTDLGSPHNLRFGVANTSILSPLALGRTTRLLERLETVSVAAAAGGPLSPDSPAGRTLALLRVGYAPQVMLNGAAGGDAKAIVPVPFAPLPRAWVAEHWRAVPDDAAALDRLFAGAEPRSEAVVEGDQAGSGSGRVVSLTDQGPNRLALEVEAAGRPLLLLPESAFPGWRAYVDGRPTPWLTAEGFARGLPLPAGRHSVRWVFAPATVRLGLFFTLCCSGLLAAALPGAGKVRRRKASKRGEVSYDGTPDGRPTAGRGTSRARAPAGRR